MYKDCSFTIYSLVVTPKSCHLLVGQTKRTYITTSSSSSCRTDMCNLQLVKCGARECTGALAVTLISLTLPLHSQVGGMNVCFEGSHDTIKCSVKGVPCSLAVVSCCGCLWRLWRIHVFGRSPWESGLGGMLGGWCNGPSEWLLSWFLECVGVQVCVSSLWGIDTSDFMDNGIGAIHGRGRECFHWDLQSLGLFWFITIWYWFQILLDMEKTLYRGSILFGTQVWY